MPPYIWIKHPIPKLTTVRLHPKERLHGRQGAVIIIPAVGMQERSELKEHIAMVNERNPGREAISEASIEEAVEKKMTGREHPKSVAQLLALGLKPGEHRKMKRV